MLLSKWLPCDFEQCHPLLCDFEQCHPLLWGGGILVDHRSTISGFYSGPVLAFGYCRCLRLSVRPCFSPSITKFVCVITHHPFKLGSPNLDHRCKRPWLRSLLFLGVIDLDLQGQIQLQSQNLPHFELVRAITHHPFKLGPPNLDQRC